MKLKLKPEADHSSWMTLVTVFKTQWMMWSINFPFKKTIHVQVVYCPLVYTLLPLKTIQLCLKKKSTTFFLKNIRFPIYLDSTRQRENGQCESQSNEQLFHFVMKSYYIFHFQHTIIELWYLAFFLKENPGNWKTAKWFRHSVRTAGTFHWLLLPEFRIHTETPTTVTLSLRSENDL